jgi:uncharacterized protein with HEPN domain
MPRSVDARIADILEAIDQIDELVSPHGDPTGCLSDRLTLRALERLIEIISEASRHLPSDLKGRHPSIEWRRVGDIGNWLRHAYQSVDPRLLTNIVINHLPSLRAALLAEQPRFDQSSPHDP